MAKLTYKFENLKEIQIDLKKLSRKAKKRIEVSTKETGVKIADQSKVNLTENKSVITGTLRRSMTSVFYPMGCYSEIGSNVHYAPNVELGTSRSRAKPYLSPAWLKFIEAYQRGLNRELRALLPAG